MVEPPLLRTDDLTLTYPGGTTALDGLTIEVPKGSIGLVGANGAGKTTLLRLALGLLQPTRGSIEVAGHRVDEDPVGVRRSLGFMPEHDCLPLDQSASDVVSTFGELAGLPVRAALMAVHRAIFTNPTNFKDGFLTIGFAGARPEIGDSYSNNGSMYITSESFLALGLPATDSFWTSPAQDWTARRAFANQPFKKDYAVDY